MNGKRWQAMAACLLGLGLSAGLAQDEARPAAPRERRGGMAARQRERDTRGEREIGRERTGGRQAERPGARLGRPFADLEEMLNDPEQAKEFGLTPEQTAALRAGFEEIGRQRAELQKAMEEAGLEQARQMTAESLDEDAIMKAVEEAGRLRTEIAKLHARQLIFARKNLSQEQLDRIRQQRRRQMIERWREQRGGREGPDAPRVRPQDPPGDDAEARRDAIRQKLQERRQQQRPAPGKPNADRNPDDLDKTW